MTAKHILINGQSFDVKPENGKTFSLKELQTLVGGYIEVIALRDGKLMVLNEEGKLEGLAVNEVATEFAQSAGIHPADVIVGNVVVMPSSMME